VGSGDEAHVVDARLGVVRRDGRGLRDGGVHVAADHERDGGSGRDAVVEDLDAGEVLRIEAQLDSAADQGGVDLVAVP